MRYLSSLMFLVGSLAVTAVAVGGEPAALNLLVITADDMNWDSAGWMGSKLGATPRLDALAAASHRFPNHHVVAPICAPSRAALMTGRVPHRSGGLGFNPIRPDTPTLVTVLRSTGYYTAVLNKSEHMKPTVAFPWDLTLTGSGKKPRLLRQQFAAALGKAAEAGKPFFINVNIQDPHRPFPGASAHNDAKSDAGPAGSRGNRKSASPAASANREPESRFRTYRPEEVVVPAFLEDIPPVREEVAQYFTAVARCDMALGGVLDALAESGHADDTIVLFLSDHGMSFPFAKATVYVNGTRSPVVLKYPGMPPAAEHSELVSSIDILPTLLDLLKVEQPSGLDGRSWVPILNGQKEQREYVVTHVNTVASGKRFPQRCLRTQDAALVFNAWAGGPEPFRVEAMSGLSYAALEALARTDSRVADRVKSLREGEPLMFFDDKTDAAERINRIGETARRGEIERMAGLLLHEMQETNDPQTEAFRRAFETWRSAAQ